MKISRNTFCELLVALAVAGCGGGGGGNGVVGDGALGMQPTLVGQVQGWNGLTGAVSALFGDANPAQPPPTVVVGNVASNGDFTMMLPAQPPADVGQDVPKPPCGDYSMGYSVVMSFMFAATSAAPVDVIVPGQHIRYIHYVWVPVEEMANSKDAGLTCAIDFKPGWNIWIDEVDTTSTATVPRYDWTGPLPSGTQWVIGQ